MKIGSFLSTKGWSQRQLAAKLEIPASTLAACRSEADATFTAAARADVPRLVAALRHALRECDHFAGLARDGGSAASAEDVEAEVARILSGEAKP